MARKKTTKKTTHRRRRKVGGIDKNLVTNIMFAAVGGIASKFIGGVLKDVALTSNSDTDSKIKSALPLVAGGLLAATMGKKDSKFMFLGLGMAAVGASNLATEFGLVSGLSNMVAGRLPISNARYLNGYNEPPKVAGLNTKIAATYC